MSEPFHVCHVLPGGRAYHGLRAYKEHAEAFLWALRELGHEATYALNGTRHDAVNIVMGAQLLTEQQLGELPARTVIYNLEQLVRQPLDRLRAVLGTAARRFPIWDFCEANLDCWRELGADPRRLRYVKIGWAPVLERITPAAQQDIEVLIYGTPSDERLGLFQALCGANLTCMFFFGLYDGERDALIARSKLVVNAAALVSRIFEISRVSYLLANAKAVVNLQHPLTIVEPDMRAALMFSAPETIAQDCLALIEDDARRAGLAETGRRAMRARDMRDILRPVIAELAGA